MSLTYYDIPGSFLDLPGAFLDFEIHSVKKKNSQPDPLSKKVTSVATEILEMAHALKEYGRLYKDKALMDRFKDGSNIDKLALAKIQQKFTTLKGRVEELKITKPRIARIFKKMVKVGIDYGTKAGEFKSFNRGVLSLIGKKNIIDSGPFSKHGIICVKDSAMPDPRPNNLVSETELKEMNALREKMFDPKADIFDIKGSSEFVSKTKWNLEKLLTVEGGRQLLTELCNCKRKLILCAGEENIADTNINTIFLTNKKSMLIGYQNGLNVSVATPPWIVMGHELIHLLHYYSGTYTNNINNENISDRRLWTDGEEYETIGDPTKDINSISENGLRKNSLHPLRIYHCSGNSQNNLEEAVNVCIDSNINGELIELLNNQDLNYQQIQQIVIHCWKRWNFELAENLLAHPIGKDIIKDHFEVFFEGAESNNDQISLEKMRLDFPIQHSNYIQHKADLLLRNEIVQIMEFKDESEWTHEELIELLSNKELTPKKIKKIVFHCCGKWDLKLAENLLAHPIGKDIIKDNFQRFYEGADSNNDQICIEKMRSDFPIEYYAYKNKDVVLSEWYISQIMSKLKGEWDSDLVRQLLHHKNIRFGSVINDIFEIAIKNVQNAQSVLGELIRRVKPHRLIFSMYLTTGLGEYFKTNYPAILEDRKEEVIKYLNGPNNIAPKMQLAIKNFFNIQQEGEGALLNT